jgi:hypothetical protein
VTSERTIKKSKFTLTQALSPQGRGIQCVGL